MGNEQSGNGDADTPEPPEGQAADGAASGPASRPGPLVPAVVAVLALIVGVVIGLTVGRGSGGGEDEGDEAAGDAEGHDDHGDVNDDGSGLAQLLADHHYEPQPDEEIDGETRQLLTAQLTALNELMEENLTIADAEDNGWARAGPFIPGLGTHYVPTDTEYTITIPTSLDGEAEGELRPVLIFDGLADDAPLVGFMPYLVEAEAGEEADPVDFAGPYDDWHRHTNLCIELKPDGTMEAPFVADMDNVTEEMCNAAGGDFFDVTTLMTHIWSIPGYDSELGLFSEVNPKITCPDGTYDRVPYDELEPPYTTTCPES